MAKAATRGRLEVRLDPERERKLDELREECHIGTSELTRRAIDLLYEEVMRERRRAAIEKLLSANIEDMPDPDELSRQMNRRYGAVS